MKLTKKLEAEITSVYNTYWKALLIADVDTYTSVLDEKFKLIGTTESEVFFKSTEAIQFLEATANQVAGNIELRNRIINIELIETLILVTEQSDTYVKINGDWSFYGKARVSSLIGKKKQEWKFIQMHLSFPDSKADEGQTIGLDKISKENLELRDAIKRRTIELENKNRELEIEAATERVRVQSMAMRHPDDLEKVNKELLHQLTKLKIEGLSGVSFYFVDKNKIVTVWDLSSPGSINDPNSYSFKYDSKKHPVLGEFVGILKSTQEEYFVLDFPKEKLLKAIEEFKKINITIYTAIKNAVESGALQHQWNPAARITDGILSVDLMTPPNDDTKIILLKMAGAFNQAYTRFLDLQKAEAQAREAKIEAALERVRAVAMSMSKPDNLLNIAESVFKELQGLGFNELRNAIIQTFVDDKKYLNDYDFSDVTGGWISRIPYTGHPIVEKFVKNIRKNKDAFVETVVSGKEMEEWKEFRKSNGEVEDPRLDGIRALFYYHYSIGEGDIGISTFSSISAENQNLLKRFRNVFDLAYQRYADIEQAEAQARESQIEAALERVRSRSMALHQSGDLHEVIKVVTAQLSGLGLKFDTTNFAEIDSEGSWDLWISTQPAQIHVPYFNHRMFTLLNEAVTNGLDFFSEVYGYEEKNIFFNHIFENSILKNIPKERKEFVLNSEGFARSVLLTKNIWLSVTKYEAIPFSDEDNSIFKRFANVFEQAYTRFVDLQKAEAQAREATIEAALEKARSRTMTMQSSDELPEVANVLFLEVQALGIPAWSCGYNILAQDNTTATCYMSSEGTLQTPFNLRLFGEASFIEIGDFIRSNQTMLVQELGNKALEEHYAYMKSFPDLKSTFDQIDELGLSLPTYQINHLCKFAQGFLLFITYEKVPASHDVFKRFTKVFEQAYTRFLDLKQAEAQTREAQIELGLERVRARAMAMQKSDELSELVDTVFKELTKLDFALNWCIINIIDASSLTNMVWAANPETNKPPESYLMKFEDFPFHHSMLKGYEKRKTKHVYVIEGKEKKTYDNYLFNKTEWRKVPKAAQAASRAMKRYVATFTFSNFGGLQTVGEEYLSEENLDILSRFGKVFDLTYTRFNDLQKAEAQTREAKINLAVERVRARALAMYKSEEILELVFKLKQEMMTLEIPNVVAATIHLKENNGTYTMWDLTAMEYAEGKLHQPMVVYYRLEEVDPNLFIKRIWDNSDPYFLVVQDEDDFTRTIQFLRNHDREKEADESEAFLKNAGIKHGYHPTVPLHNGRMCIDLLEPPSDEIEMILTKMGAAFDLAYKRFEDLKNSEFQLREAQIEAAFERVRSRSMAMHKSEELLEAGEILFLEMQKLGIESLTAGYVLMDKGEKNGLNYTPHPGTKKIMPVPVTIPHNETILMQQVVENWKKGKPFFIVEMDEAETIKHQNFIAERSTHFPLTAAELIAISPAKLFLHNFNFKEGYILIVGGTKLSAEQLDIMLRFTNVFQQTYTRFLDLQKAEAQAREAEIELALERVRARTMAMQHSEELVDVATVLFQQVKSLGVPQWNCGFNIWNIGDDKFTYYPGSPDGIISPSPCKISLTEHPIFKRFDESRKQGDELLIYEKEGEEQADHYRYMLSLPGVGDLLKSMLDSGFELPKFQIDHLANFAYGNLIFITYEQFPEMHEVFKRFAKVFEQTYTRFLDLQKAEAQAREAQIEAALERVRSRTLAMQKSEELAETAAVLFQQLIKLGIAPNRLYIGIIKDDSGDIEAWATDEAGGKINNRFTLNRKKNASVLKMYDGWKAQKKSITIEMKGKELAEYLQYLSGEIGVSVTVGLSQERRVQNVAYFGKGFIGIASPDHQPEETIQLIERFTAVFNLTYTRFNDLKISEAHGLQAKEDLIKLQIEKKRAEDALSELKATQTQLIQSEKMASLGELTAGIAHEIQNPLNFVNNFSEINTELIDELTAEAEKGDLDEVRLIAKDIKENEEKINLHGKRASNIVKGMLEHSRTSSGQKELTDINALADEYLKLTYHGLRAKDKSFNSGFEINFDKNLPKIAIVPQDFGRVFLNLVNNAFYAVNEKQKAESYKPTVTISTKSINGKVEITISDNGNGIPQDIIDKIFQPFFTTKPTGKGTGLGLSLAYDIVKAHGGELKVKTKQGEGSEFIILLPII